MTKLILGAAMGLLASVGTAGTINEREAAQRARIHHEVRTGELTRAEATRLRAGEAAIRAEERAYRADGHVGPWERADLQRDLNRESRAIARQSHDRQER